MARDILLRYPDGLVPPECGRSCSLTACLSGSEASADFCSERHPPRMLTLDQCQVFISYSHADAAFVDKLAMQLVQHRTQIWLDRWELKVGDSIVDRVQQAVAGASALIVVLSKASVASEWCKKELNVGLIRELEEKRVVVLPVLIEDCEIPLFLRDKKYADFRTNFDRGLADVLEATARVTTDTRSRIETPDWHLDWSIDWGRLDGKALFVLTIVEQAVDKPYSCLTTIRVLGNEEATARCDVYEEAGLDWVYRQVVVKVLTDGARDKDLRIVLSDSRPQRKSVVVQDSRSGIQWSVEVECRLMGEDTGADVLLDIAGQLQMTLDHMMRASRRTTAEEQQKLERILTPMRR
jgi:hypothetical protein